MRKLIERHLFQIMHCLDQEDRQTPGVGTVLANQQREFQASLGQVVAKVP